MKEDPSGAKSDVPGGKSVLPSAGLACAEVDRGSSPAQVGQELRAPLARIHGRITQILQTPLTPAQRHHLDVVRTAANALQLLVDTQFPAPPGESAAKPGDAAGALPARSLRILVVEDNAINRLIVQRFLSARQHVVRLAFNGREAVEVYDNDPFDLVLMDLHMPEMDGLEATARLRDRQAAIGRRVPIVALTASVTDEDRTRCLAAGMDDFLTKPIQIAELLRVLGTCSGQLV